MDNLSVALEVLDDYNSTENIICKDLCQPATYIRDLYGNVTILHYNIRSLKAHFDELCLNIDTLNEKTDISVIILSETWILDDISHYTIKGYSSYYNEASYNKCDVTVIVGDINIDILDENTLTMNAIAYTNMLAKNSFIPQVTVPTRVERHSATTIDHISTYVNTNTSRKNEIKFQTFVIENSLSDHYPLLYNMQFKNKVNSNDIANKTTYSKLNEDIFVTKLNSINWDSVYQTNSAQVATDLLYKYFSDAVAKSVTTVEVNNKKTKIKPWMTAGILTSIRKRDLLKKKCIAHRNNETINQEYRSYRNTLANLIKVTKSNYYINKLSTLQNNYKKTWNIINEISNCSKAEKKQINQISLDGAMILNPEEIASSFNNFFINIADELTTNIPDNSESNIARKQNIHSLFLQPVDCVEIENMISDLKAASSPGKDNLSARTIKLAKHIVSKPLTHIINLIFESALIPTQFKESVVIPIHKSGRKDKMTNYRPISLLNNFAKIFEKCLNKRIWHFLDKHKIISQNQFGFRKNISTEHCIENFTSQILSSFDLNKKTLVTFLDLKKAFDTVSHPKLLSKLEDIGFRGNVLNLCNSYLSGRQQQVRISDIYSTAITLKCGIPQGTILGPILFLIFINDMLNYDQCKILSYADDTVLICESDSWLAVHGQAQKAINDIKAWLHENKLCLNISKTKFMCFSPTRASAAQNVQPLKINNITEEIEQTHIIKYLGLFVDENLKWTAHIENLAKRLKKLTHRFSTLRNILNKKLIIIVYRSLLESLLNYGIIVWGSAYNTLLRKIQISQNFILRAIFNISSRQSVKHIYQSNEILDVKGLYINATVKLIHKKNDLDKICHSYKTRGCEKGLVKYNRYHKTISQKNVYYNGIKLYNKIPEEYKLLPPRKFKNKLKEYIIKNLNSLISYIS
nr:unnamed protein product [Callosobruchus chinensis]